VRPVFYWAGECTTIRAGYRYRNNKKAPPAIEWHEGAFLLENGRRDWI
jgi:hypothetical protein